MPINFKSKFSWGQKLYITDDPEQLPRSLVAITLVSGTPVYSLSIAGEVVEVYEYNVSDEPDQEILLNIIHRED